MRWMWFALALVAVAVVAACKSPGPCYGLGVGTSISITIVDYYSGNPNYPQDSPGAIWPGSAGPPGGDSCFFGFDVTQGQVIEATVQSEPVNTQADCRVGIPTFGPIGSWTWSDPGELDNQGSPSILAGMYTATNGVCNGFANVTLLTGEGVSDIFAPSVVGQPPSAVLQRQYVGTPTAACRSGCDADWVVNLQRQP